MNTKKLKKKEKENGEERILLMNNVNKWRKLNYNI